MINKQQSPNIYKEFKTQIQTLNRLIWFMKSFLDSTPGAVTIECLDRNACNNERNRSVK